MNLCILQHVHDEDLKGLFYDYERLLSVSRLEDADEESRGMSDSVGSINAL